MTTKTMLLAVIRKHCIECMGGMVLEVEKCTAPKCLLFPFRMGKDPTPARANVERGKHMSKAVRESKSSLMKDGQESINSNQDR